MKCDHGYYIDVDIHGYELSVFLQGSVAAGSLTVCYKQTHPSPSLYSSTKEILFPSSTEAWEVTIGS
jgi:hypothetical protein